MKGAKIRDDQLGLIKKLDGAIMPDGSTYVPKDKPRKGTGDGTVRASEKRRATASGLAASLARIKGEKKEGE